MRPYMRNIIKWAGLAVAICSGFVFAFASPLMGYWMAVIGLLAHYTVAQLQMHEGAMNLIDDRRDSWQRLIEKGDYRWVTDRMVTVAKRDGLSAQTQDQAQKVRDEVVRLEDAAARAEAKDTKAN